MTDQITLSRNTVEQALKRAFNLGQIYWQQADSEYSSQWKKADETRVKFEALVFETISDTAETKHIR